MKHINYWVVVIFCMSCSFVLGQQAQQKIEMRIDSIGNAKINMSMTMNAQQWQQWTSTLGNNPAALKREVERGMPGYFLDDFKLEKNDMDRSFNLSLKAYGVCEIDKRGNWMIDVDQENAQLTELAYNKFMFVSSPPELGGQVQQTFLVTLPESGKNIKVAKDAYGKDVFKFSMDAPSQMGFGGILQWAGILFVVAGIGWMLKMKLTS